MKTVEGEILMTDISDIIEMVQKHLDSSIQNWLFGAGISYNSNVPLMIPLTKKIRKEILKKGVKKKDMYLAIEDALPKGSHIEMFLSHIGDLLALIDRTKGNKMTIEGYTYTKANLLKLYKEIIGLISQTVRYGYYIKSDSGEEIVGDIKKPIVKVCHHQSFVQALFNRQSDLQSRKRVNFFTTNYDTLLEDALVMERKSIVDGFTGGAMGFWNPEEYRSDEKINLYHIYKLHGSIDWYKDEKYGLIRSRYGTTYLSNQSNVMIYPQATKYVETQKDPFAALFNAFRQKLQEGTENILAVCGYSFGDDHINSEIENAMSLPGNNTTLLVFIQEQASDQEGETILPYKLSAWSSSETIGDRIFVLTDKGIYYKGVLFTEAENIKYNWWTFDGVSKLLMGEIDKYEL